MHQRLRWRFLMKPLATFIVSIQIECDFHQNLTATRFEIGFAPARGDGLRCLQAICFGETCWPNVRIELHRSGQTNQSDVMVFLTFQICRICNRTFHINVNNGRIVIFRTYIMFAQTYQSWWSTEMNQLTNDFVRYKSGNQIRYTKRLVRIQWAALRTYRSLINEPPQRNWRSLSSGTKPINAMCGNSPWFVTLPPTTSGTSDEWQRGVFFSTALPPISDNSHDFSKTASSYSLHSKRKRRINELIKVDYKIQFQIRFYLWHWSYPNDAFLDVWSFHFHNKQLQCLHYIHTKSALSHFAEPQALLDNWVAICTFRWHHFETPYNDRPRPIHWQMSNYANILKSQWTYRTFRCFV